MDSTDRHARDTRIGATALAVAAVRVLDGGAGRSGGQGLSAAAAG